MAKPISRILTTIFLILISASNFSPAKAATFTVKNECSYTVWAAAVPGGGQELPPQQTWTFDVAAGTKMGRVWARTGCTFDANGQGTCQTGDCGGKLSCSAWGKQPATLAEYALNQDQNNDFFDISLIEGFNVPLSIVPSTAGSIAKCETVSCTADITSACPSQLKTTGGCNNACAVFGTQQYCCNDQSQPCSPTDYSQFFKQQCPQAYSYPKDDATSTFTCPGGTDYRVVFCGTA
eukprot:TRINITY_DN1401_c0_g1_i3.p1 TRINITY_DN1401_c0_g1~~TRINITY_DN1401_c0_g1_i3.p1  ORF type:complete len:249 (+),score=-17.42 TRINITY_DN1401_c0_g1_i3:41-748(+)